jgi:hypothetical protein
MAPRPSRSRKIARSAAAAEPAELPATQKITIGESIGELRKMTSPDGIFLYVSDMPSAVTMKRNDEKDPAYPREFEISMEKKGARLLVILHNSWGHHKTSTDRKQRRRQQVCHRVQTLPASSARLPASFGHVDGC